MADPRETLFHRWFEEVWNKNRLDAVDEMLSPDAIIHGLKDSAGNELRGPAGFKPFQQQFRAAFPDIRVSVEDTVVEGPKIAARCIARGTHQGPLGPLAATGKPIELHGMCFGVIENGIFVEAWNTWDFVSMYQQLGVSAI